jgi:cell division control protein 6
VRLPSNRPTVVASNSLLPASKLSLSRKKRQARPEIFNDENENPFIVQSARDDAQDGDSMDLDELSEPVYSPVKHGVSRTRTPLSPSKAKAQFNIAKSNDGQ